MRRQVEGGETWWGSEHQDCLQLGACDARYTTCLDDCDATPPEGCALIY